jgi:hypothetical protein
MVNHLAGKSVTTEEKNNDSQDESEEYDECELAYEEDDYSESDEENCDPNAVKTPTKKKRMVELTPAKVQTKKARVVSPSENSTLLKIIDELQNQLREQTGLIKSLQAHIRRLENPPNGSTVEKQVQEVSPECPKNSLAPIKESIKVPEVVKQSGIEKGSNSERNNKLVNAVSERTSWADIAKKGVKDLSRAEKKRIIAGGQECKKPQEFYRLYIQYKARTMSFSDKKKKVKLFLKITKLNKAITDYSIVKDMIEIYVCDAQLDKVIKIINENRLVLIQDFNPADFSMIVDEAQLVIVREKTIKRLGFLLSKARSHNHKESILAGFDEEMREAASSTLDASIAPESIKTKPQFRRRNRIFQEINLEMIHDLHSKDQTDMEIERDLAASVGCKALQ